jgi:hypothetical protein
MLVGRQSGKKSFALVACTFFDALLLPEVAK